MWSLVNYTQLNVTFYYNNYYEHTPIIILESEGFRRITSMHFNTFFKSQKS